MHHNIFCHDMNTCIHSKDNCDKCDIALQKKSGDMSVSVEISCL